MASPRRWLAALALSSACLLSFAPAGCGGRPAGRLVYDLPDPPPQPGPQQAPSQAPEGASGWTDKPGWSASSWMVAAANPLATDAGYQVLRAGGSAVDAAIAVQMVLTLVEPQSSGIGGGAFLVHYDGARTTVLDGRETAPAAATPDLFLDGSGVPLPVRTAIVGGRSVGTPGVLRMLETAHRAHGRLPWADLFEPAIALAEQGFAVSPRLATLLAQETSLQLDPVARAHFFTAEGAPLSVGTRLRNQALADVLRRVAREGTDAFYTGDIARAIVDRVRSHRTNPGFLTLDDLATYAPVEREPLCFPYRHVRVCGAPPPGSGTLALGQILGMLEQHDLRSLAPTRGADGRFRLHPEAVHLYAEAARLAFADRDAYVADPAFVDVPVAGLLADDYLAARAALIGPTSMRTASAGRPVGAPVAALGTSLERPSTSHISVVDAQGHVVSMTTTIEDAFGSRLMVHGFLLNNQLTDFSLAPQTADGHLVANRVEGGKRPRSSMAPVLVFDRASGRLLMTLGSPGGSAIINYVGKVLVATIDWGLTVQEAIDLPNFGSRNGPTELEADRVAPDLARALEARGHAVRLMPQTSGLQGIARTAEGWFGGADPRREGIARGH